MAADGLSGDGCGVLIHGAQRFLRVLADEAGIALHPGSIAAGNVFLPADDNQRSVFGQRPENWLARRRCQQPRRN